MIKNLSKNADRLLKSEKIAWPHRTVNVISERKKSLRSRVEPGYQDRFLKNVSLAKVWLRDTDSALGQLNDLVFKVKKIIIQMMDKTSNHEVRKQAAKEVEKLFIKILEIANSQNMGRYIFPSKQPMTSPFLKEEKRPAYECDTEKMEPEIQPGSNIRIDLLGSDFLTKPLKTLGENFNLDPGIEQNTRLSDLNLGRGVNLGSIRINNGGMFWDINLRRATTVGDVIDSINSSGIAGLSADINASQKGLKLTYTGLNESNSGQEFIMSKASGTTARDLGILGNLLEESASHPSSLEGQDLNPILTEKTPISLLKSGDGLTLGTIRIALGATQRIVDLNSASTTVGEIIGAINSSMPNVIASINDSKKGISIDSRVLGRSLVIYDEDDKKSAQNLGISGSPDVLGTLLFLMEGLNNGDCQAISNGLETLNLSLEEILSHREKTWANLKRLENIETRLISFQPNTPRLLSEVSRADVSRATMDLVNQRSVFQSALKKGVAMIQPTLLNFIK